MLRKFIFVILALFVSIGVFAQSGTLKGKVIDKKTGQTIPFANVSLMQGGSIITGGMTNISGQFVIKPIPAGKYSVKASYMGYSPLQLEGVLIRSGKITFQDFRISESAELLPTVEIKEYKIPLIDKEGGSSTTVTSDDIAKMPGRSASAVAVTVGGVYSEDGSVGSIRGARSDATEYYIDGVKVRGSSSLPKSAIEQVNVVQGGIPAKYGDVTGGVISITTKGPSRQMFGGIEVVSSGFGPKKGLDNYGYNLVGFSVSGPLLKIKDKENPEEKVPLMGFFLSGEVSHNAAGSSSVPIYKIKQDTLDYLIENPLRKADIGFGAFSNAEFLTADAFDEIYARENTASINGNFAGKVEIQPNRNFNLTLGGTYNYSDGRGYNYSGSLFNSDNNSQSIYNNWRAYARITQKFSSMSQEEQEKSASLLSNAYYSIQVDYSKTTSKTQDYRHQDNFFDYGYVGKFKTYSEPSYAYGTDTVSGLTGYIQNNYRDTLYSFEENTEINPILSQYTQSYYDLYNESMFQRNKEQIQAGGALLNGQMPGGIYNIWSAPGIPSGGYNIGENSQFRVTASGSADIKDHEISIGFEFEQRNDRYYGVSPIGLWSLARGYVNDHISELDISNPILVQAADGTFLDTINYDRKINLEGQYLFDRKFREHLGLDPNGSDWIDLDSYDPSELDISYFSAEELLNGGSNLVAYSGYDAYGNRIDNANKSSFKDFFTATDEYGRLTRPIAPFEPTYAAGYIQDKFAFNDLIFNVGVRVDRYDANQMVLKDPFSLYETRTVGEVTNLGNHPSNIGDDYIVYVDNVNNPTKIVGYRNTIDVSNNSWFDANGTEISDPNLLNTSTGISPYLVDPNKDFGPDAFKDYDPQITVMPRISFSFPISEVALFFAHYDVLSQRPTTGVQLSPLDYLYINQKNNNILSNPDAKPQKTIDYELGFQQKLSGTSSLKVSSFYREMRDMQQAVAMVGAYPVNYKTYGNIDFGTVKGFTATYDMRRTGNVSLRASYTLQFASGTGSNAQSGANLINSNQPNLRTLIPLDYDQRHNLSVVLDYRFDGKANGRSYDGPKLFGKDLFANTGANFVIQTGSGSPYSKQSQIKYLGGGGTLDGSINGSRKPWRTNINLRVDRDVRLSWGKGEDDSKKTAMLNIYLDVQNLFNTRNIIGVYQATGNAEDDGYLNAADSQSTIATQLNPESFRYYYGMYINTPWNYSRPRTIRLGVQLSF